MASKKSIKINYFYSASYQILSIIIPLILTPYVSRVLGADSIGQYSYAAAFASYFALVAALGVTMYGRREISSYQDDKDKYSQIFWDTKTLQLLISFVVVILYVIFSLLQKNPVFYLIFLFNILSVTVDISWFYQGLEEFKKIVLRDSFFKIVNVAFIFMMVKEKNDLIWYVFGMTFFTFISHCSLWLSLSKFVNKPDWKKINPWRNIKIILSLFLPTVAIEIYTVLDKTMLGLITHNDFENGYYEQAIKMAKMTMTLVTTLGPVIIPRISYYFQHRNKELLESTLYNGYKFVWFLAFPLCFGLIGIASNLVPWFYGSGYEKVIYLLYILGFLIVAIGINSLTGHYLIVTKRQNIYTGTLFTGAVTNFLLNIILIHYFQSVGAAIASLVAEITIALLGLYVIRKEISVFKILRFGIKDLVAALVMLLVLVYENSILTPSIINTFLMIFSGAMTYFICLFLLRDNYFLSNAKMIWQRGLKVCRLK